MPKRGKRKRTKIMTTFEIPHIREDVRNWAEAFKMPALDLWGPTFWEHTVDQRLRTLLNIDSDDRLESLLEPKGKFTVDEMRQAEAVIGGFLDSLANQEIVDLAGKILDEGRKPQDIAKEWLTPARSNAFKEVLKATEIRDKLTIACYTYIEVYELAYAGYLLQQNRRLPRTDFAANPPTPEELASDEVFASTLRHQ